MKQQSLEVSGFEKYRKKTRKEMFLDEMNEIIAWGETTEAIAPYCPKEAKGAGSKPIGLERMLRIHFLQHWFELSEAAAEEILYALARDATDCLCVQLRVWAGYCMRSRAMRQFAGIDLCHEAASDETTICKFRHLMEKHNLGEELFPLVNVYLSENTLKVSRGTIVDASIISAPSATRNKDKQRDRHMHQSRKGTQWYFGMKTHIGVDSKTRLIHSVVVTPGNVHDSQVMGDLLHGDETRVWGDSAYTGQTEVLQSLAPNAQDFTQDKGSRHRQLSDKDRAKNQTKSKIRARVEHVFGIMKRQFGYNKVCYKGLNKNAHAVFTKCALVKLAA